MLQSMRQSLRVSLRARERALLVGSAAALAALLLGCSGSGKDKAGGAKNVSASAAHYSDPVGDGGAAPDIRAIDVRSTPDGRLTFRVTLGQLSSSSKTGVNLWLDTDTNPETGNTTFEDASGTEYQLTAFVGSKPSTRELYTCGQTSAGNGCFSQWSGDSWFAADAPTSNVTRAASQVTFSINRSDLGQTGEFNFFVTRGGKFSDRAPGTGTFNYSLAFGGPRRGASARPGDDADKAGGKSDSKPVVLTLASRDYPPVPAASEFASAVGRLSHGSIRIDVKYGKHYYEIDYEQGIIADIRNAVLDLAVVSARAWDAAGVKTFNALVAPFLVDSYALQQRVLESSLPERMLEGVEPLGLVGVAVVPGELRRPLGLSRALVRPADYRGARVGIRPSGVAEATFDALGADATGFQAGRPDGLVGFDGAESNVSTILNNRYHVGARALTANVVLWPKPNTIFMNRKRFDALTAEQQDTLKQAGLDVIEPVLTAAEDAERKDLEGICGSRLPLVMASPADRAALRRAVQPVYDELERDSLTRELIAEIEDLRGNKGAADEPLRCPNARRRSDASDLDGAWGVEVTRKDLRAAGAQLEQFQRAEGPWWVEFDDGRWVARNLESRNVYRGTYTVEGDVLRETLHSCNPTNICTPGGFEEYTWSVYRKKLKLARIPGRAFNYAMIAKPLTPVR
jgi:TRAP-type C4-dicarboxylate transport system substrate-binding protein